MLLCILRSVSGHFRSCRPWRNWHTVATRPIQSLSFVYCTDKIIEFEMGSIRNSNAWIFLGAGDCKKTDLGVVRLCLSEGGVK